MYRPRISSAGATMLAAGAAGAIGFGVGRADAAAGTTYTRAVIGTEFRPIDFRVSAHVTNVTFYYSDCGFPVALATYYFGSYNSSAHAYTEILPEASGNHGTCGFFTSVSRPTPGTAVQVGYRYVLGVHSLYSSQGATPPAERPAWVVSGARVRFTCPTPCAP